MGAEIWPGQEGKLRHWNAPRPSLWAFCSNAEFDTQGTSPKSSQDTERTPSLKNRPPAEPLRIPSQDGYKLQPIAYSPNPQIDEDFEERDGDDRSDGEGDKSWDEGDEEPVQSPEETAEPKSLTPQVPPRLPLLYFEQDRVDQIDFAYKHRSRSTSRGTTAGPSRADLQNDAPPLPTSKPGEDIPAARQLEKIDTEVGAKKDEASHKDEGVKSPDSKKPDDPGNKEEKGGSFFWHSPHSSTDEGSSSPKPLDDALDETKQSEEGKKSGKPPQEPLNLKKITSSIPENSLTSATALEFGGPSDWEHFGDYDAEEVDDIALYTSNKPKTAELPGTASNEEAQEQDKPIEGRSSLEQAGTIDREMLPTIQERQSEAFEDEAAVKQNGNQEVEEEKSSASSSSHDIRSPSAQEQERTPRTHLSPHQDDDQTETSYGPVKQDGTVQDGKESPRKLSAPPQEQSRPEAGDQIQHNNSGENVGPRNDSDQSKEGGTTNSSVRVESRRMHSQDRAAGRSDSKQHRTGSDASGFRGFSRQSAVASTLSSPIDEDDGKENIIISLQVPESAPPDMNQQTMSPDQRFRDNVQMASAHTADAKTLASPEMPQSGRRSVFPQSIEMEDPYAGLDPWAKASLNRYVKMLREEAQAPTDEEKFTIFINFTHSETRVRSVLYDMDDESDMSEHPSRHASIKATGNSLKPRISMRSKALPALPPKDDIPPMPKPVIQSPNVRSEPMLTSSDTTDRAMTNKVTEKNSNGGLHDTTFQSPASRTQGGAEEAFVMVDTPSDDKLATGKQKGSKDKSSNQTKGTPTLSSWKRALEIVSPRIGTNVKDANPQPNGTQEQAKTGLDPKASPLIENGDREASDISFKPSEGRAYEGDKAANRQTIYRPFSTLLRTSSVRHVSGESGKHESKGEGDEIHSAGSSGRPPLPFLEPKPVTRPVNYRYTVLEPLIQVIPQEGLLQQEPAQLARLRQATDAVPDDFSFIHKTVLAWDAEAKKARERHDLERHARERQEEARVDALFHDHEIGYGDIPELEAEFKRVEAARKAEEDREEVATFVAGVFDVVWARINYEMDQLTPLYDECTALVSAASAGRGMFEEENATAAAASASPGAGQGPAATRVPIAPAMEILLVLYQKLMVRHQKAFEAVLERDRRLKKTEVAPWYALGSIEKVKRIEKRFEDAEKKAILEFCRQRDERANLLMDVLDQNTLRGVGANQDYMESIMQAVRKIAVDVTRAGSPRPGAGANAKDARASSPSGNTPKDANGGPTPLGADDAVSTDEVLKAQTVTAALARSSEQIVQTFHVADMLLNAADYEVSVANAKLSNADAAAFRRLREAKAKEDSKLAMDLEHRMGLIRGDTVRTQEEIEKLLGLLAARAERKAAAAAKAASAAVMTAEGPGAGPGESSEEQGKGEKETKGQRATTGPDEGKRKKKP